jgi:hypothetical protein
MDSQYDQIRFARLQEVTIQQFGDMSSLLLAFAGASFGYCFTLIKDSGFVPAHAAKQTLWWSLLCLFLSIFAGFIGLILRSLALQERIAAQTRYEQGISNKPLSDRTWLLAWLIYGQLFTFLLGAAWIVMTVLRTYGAKLL